MNKHERAVEAIRYLQDEAVLSERFDRAITYALRVLEQIELAAAKPGLTTHQRWGLICRILDAKGATDE